MSQNIERIIEWQTGMDFSFILVIGLGAILASSFMILAEITSRRVSIFRLPVFITFIVSMALMQPWRASSTQEVGMSVMMLVFVIMWAVTGWIIGAIPTALILPVFRWVSGMARKWVQ